MEGGVWAIVVAAGEGRRFGGPKQFERLSGRSVVEWSVGSARAAVDEVVLVLPSAQLAEAALHAGCLYVTKGGMTRADSVRAGLAMVPDDAEIIVVHDAARPLATPSLFFSVISAVRSGADGAIPAVQISDTVKRVAEGRVIETLERDGLFSVQTPQAFQARVLRRAHAGRADATDDAALVEAIGGGILVVPGEARNRKITDQDDVAVFEQYLAQAQAEATRTS
ncbi:MAG: 2-C-methyl-D-erythritol 4-phosphate cytidylyltransferase [Acidimicrobiales bacterium]